MAMLRTRFRALIGSNRGAAIIELAMAAPLFAAFLVGMVDIGRAYSTKLQLEQASQRAIEKVMNGQSGANVTMAASLKTEAATIAGVTETSSNPTVDYWLECSGARQSDYNTSCSSAAIERRYMSVSINKTFTPMFTVTKLMGSNANGTFTLVGKTSVRIQ